MTHNKKWFYLVLITFRCSGLFGIEGNDGLLKKMG